MKLRLLQLALATSLILASVVLFALDASASTGTGPSIPECTVDVTSGGFSNLNTLDYTMYCQGLETPDIGLANIVAVVDYEGSGYAFGAVYCGTTGEFTPAVSGCGGAGYYTNNPGAGVGIYTGFTGLGGNCSAFNGGSCNTGPQPDQGNLWEAAVPCPQTGASGSCVSFSDSDLNTVMGNVGFSSEVHGIGAAELTFDAATPSCFDPTVTGDYSEPTADGTTPYTYAIDFSGGADLFALVDDSDTGSTTTVLGQAFPTASTGFDGNRDGTVPLATPARVTYTPLSGDVVNPDVWCYGQNVGGGAGWIDFGKISTFTAVTQVPGPGQSGSGTTLGQCLDGSGLSLDPSSWVPGLVDDTGCLLQWLFIPQSADVTSLAQTFGITSNTPTGSDSASQWLGSMSKSVTAFPYETVADIQSSADAGGCSLSILGQTDTLAGHSISACTILADASSPSTSGASDLEWLQLILSAVIYVFGALLMFHFVKKMIEQ